MSILVRNGKRAAPARPATATSDPEEPDAFSADLEAMAPSVRQKLEALERPDNPLTLPQIARRCLTIAPDLYRIPPVCLAPTAATPGSETKIQVLQLRIFEGCCSPFHPQDLRWERVADRVDAELPTDAGNGLPGSVATATEFSDVDLTDDAPPPPKDEPLATTCRRYLEEDWQLRPHFWARPQDQDRVAHVIDRTVAADAQLRRVLLGTIDRRSCRPDAGRNGATRRDGTVRPLEDVA